MDRTPLHVLTGFLGSGKTTLLNRLLRDPELADSAVLINEIGDVSIDHHLVERMAPGDALDVMVLKGGCTCCVLRGDLVAALRELYERRADGSVAFRRVVLETTGLADPAPILFTLVGDPVLRHKFVAGATIATVDAVHGAAQTPRHPEFRKQVAVADRVVVTKSDLAGAGAVEALAALLRGLNPAAEILDAQAARPLTGLLNDPSTDWARAPDLVRCRPREGGDPAITSGEEAHGRRLLDAGLRGHDTLWDADGSGQMHAPSADHTPDVASIAITLDRPLEWSAFAVWLSLLLHAHGDRILRFKALLDVAGWPAPVALNGIHHLIHPPIHLPAWPAGPRNSRLVFIAQGLEMAPIERSLRGFGGGAGPRLAQPATMAATA